MLVWAQLHLFMIFKNLKLTTDFIDTIVAKVCYIYKIDMKDGAISTVCYYRYDNGKVETKYAKASWFSMQLIKNKFVAYCGKIKNGYLTEIAKVLPMIKEGKPYLTTMVDDEDTNNLVTLLDYYR